MLKFVNGRIVPKFLSSKKFLPTDYVKTFFDIDFDKLYEEGKRVILTDLDNTLISYKYELPDEKLENLLKELNKKFEIVIVSNNRKARVSKFSDYMGFEYVYSARKPFKKGIKKGIKKLSHEYNKKEMIFFGDQLMTDAWAANRCKIDVILVDAVDKKTEKWYTKFNRTIEVGVMRKLEKKHETRFNEMRLGEKK